ncbi:MAG: SGNH/GDSL hydrolase family protein [Bacteroidota bacterium]
MTIIPIVITILVMIVWYKQYEKSFFNKPPNYPDIAKINDENKPIFIGFGDSLTQANMSADWLKILEEKQPDFQYFNAGMNAELTSTLLERIEEVIACQPQIISLLVGINDVNATTSEKRMKRYYDLGKITQDADFDGFKANYLKIVEALRSQTNAQILLISLPPITEDWDFWVNKRCDEYNDFIKNLAEAEGLIYVPFRETLRTKMPLKSDQINDFEKTIDLIRWAGIQKNLMGRSWNEIAKNRKAQYLTDNIHLNTEAAEILANLVNEAIKNLVTNE